MPQLVLASTSEFRKTLLKQLNIPFSVCHAPIDETPRAEENASELAQRLALAKARAGIAQHHDAWIIGSDQTACIERQFLNKPGNFANACKQLALCSDKLVEFHTSVCLLNAVTDQYSLTDVLSKVQFRKLNDEEIERYVKHEQAYGCAGGFRSEAYGVSLFKSINSDDPSALMGLPLIATCQMLRNAGWDIP